MEFDDIESDSEESSSSDGSGSGRGSKRTQVFVKSKYGTTVVEPDDCFCGRVARHLVVMRNDEGLAEYESACSDHVGDVKGDMEGPVDVKDF